MGRRQHYTGCVFALFAGDFGPLCGLCGRRESLVALEWLLCMIWKLQHYIGKGIMLARFGHLLTSVFLFTLYRNPLSTALRGFFCPFPCRFDQCLDRQKFFFPFHIYLDPVCLGVVRVASYARVASRAQLGVSELWPWLFVLYRAH